MPSWSPGRWKAAGTIPDDPHRSTTLAAIAQQVAARDPVLAAELFDRAVELAGTIPENEYSEDEDPEGEYEERSWALAAIAQRMAASDPADAGRIGRAVELAGTIPSDLQRARSLGDIAQKTAASDPALAAELFDRAVALAGTIPDDHERSWALAALAYQVADSDPADEGRISRAVELAGTIPDDQQRAWSLGDIAQKRRPATPRWLPNWSTGWWSWSGPSLTTGHVARRYRP